MATVFALAWLVACSVWSKWGSPWAESPGEGASNLLEWALGGTLLMQLLVGFDAEGAARRVAAESDVWTDGSLVEDKVSGAGAGCFTYRGSRL